MQTDQDTLRKTRRVNTPILPQIEDRFDQLVAGFPDQSEPQLAASLLAAGLGDRDLLDTLIKERKTLQNIAAAIEALQAKPTCIDCTPAIERLGAEIARVQREHIAFLKRLELSQDAVREECAACSRTQIEALTLIAVSLKKLLDQPPPVHPDHGPAIAAMEAKIDAFTLSTAAKPRRDPVLFGAVALACILAGTACFTRFALPPTPAPPALTTTPVAQQQGVEEGDPRFTRAQNDARLDALSLPPIPTIHQNKP